MGRLLCCFLALSGLTGVGLLTSRAAAQAAMPGALRVGESKPITVNDAQFTVVAQTEWQPGKPWSDDTRAMRCIVAPLDIQLRITNLRKSAVLFPTAHAFGVRLLTVDGKEVTPRAARKAPGVTKAVLIPGGASYSLCRLAELRWNEKTGAADLFYYDGTGSRLVIGPLEPGRYKLVFWYVGAPDKLGKQKSGDTAMWVGEVVTGEVLIAVLDRTARGRPLVEPERPLLAVTDILRIRESKPVTVKDAKFVVLAETDWKPGKGNVPIDLQLRITNLSKTDVVFHIFDSFALRLIDEGGKRILPTGGRNATLFTRPVLLPAGASYTLGPEDESHAYRRRAEMRWNGKSKAAELVYYNGTGCVEVYGPLRPGQYKLGFSYGVPTNSPFTRVWEKQHKKMDAPSIWLGGVITDEVVIKVLDH
jgi:hypothetical protein